MGPIIGVLIRYGQNERGTSLEYIFDNLRCAIIAMGGEPLLLCPVQQINYFTTKRKDYPPVTRQEQERASYWLDQCDGLLIPGGDKISPYDFFILQEALKRNIPILGICLGMQILANYQNESILLEPVANPSKHTTDCLEKYAHQVHIEKDSLLYRIVGQEEIEVNSLHRQQVTTPTGLKVSAKSPDGIIEAVEIENYPFALGVQWHPERMLAYDCYAQKIMSAFIKASRNKRK